MSEIGWALCRSATGRGYAREGAAAAIDCAVDTLGWTDFGHVIVPENAASIRLARRFGFPIPTAGKRADVWAQTAAGWRAWRQGGG